MSEKSCDTCTEYLICKKVQKFEEKIAMIERSSIDPEPVPEPCNKWTDNFPDDIPEVDDIPEEELDTILATPEPEGEMYACSGACIDCTDYYGCQHAEAHEPIDDCNLEMTTCILGKNVHCVKI
jgi:hypothetical protein